jgi:hypothetical protein
MPAGTTRPTPATLGLQAVPTGRASRGPVLPPARRVPVSDPVASPGADHRGPARAVGPLTRSPKIDEERGPPALCPMIAA